MIHVFVLQGLTLKKIEKSVPDWAKEEEGLLDELGIEEFIRNCGD